MEAGLSIVLEPCIDFHAAVQQEIDDIRAAELTSPRKGVPHFLHTSRGLQATVIRKECLDDIEATDSRSPF